MELSILDRKDRLILTAIEIIDELGMQGLSTREIAKRQGASEATLFRHYKTKNNLLLAMLASEPMLAGKIKKSFFTRIGFLQELIAEAQKRS